MNRNESNDTTIPTNCASLFQFNVMYKGKKYEFALSRVSGKLIVMEPSGIEIPDEVMKIAKTLMAVNFRLIEKQKKEKEGDLQMSLFE